MVILGSQNKITDFFMILDWASPFKLPVQILVNSLDIDYFNVIYMDDGPRKDRLNLFFLTKVHHVCTFLDKINDVGL